MVKIQRFTGTRIQEIIDGLESIYIQTEEAQKAWKAVTPFQCEPGCGTCCVDFEPDILESEALYLAAWMLENQKERAIAILEGTFMSPRLDPERGCIFFDPSTPYHCTVYEGRCIICRLFGYTGDKGKDGKLRFKPCKFLPFENIKAVHALRKQYTAEELLEYFGAIPPIMSDLTAQILCLTPDTIQERKPLREALPLALGRIVMIMRFFEQPPEPLFPEPAPITPTTLAS
ncbi:MAG TPA: YkgJ family cysteine cluster protein [Treponemataceae bacterium]|nr:YkgJ family cysteine cluster protein [Treponemataceae bacterium]